MTALKCYRDSCPYCTVDNKCNAKYKCDRGMRIKNKPQKKETKGRK